MKIKVLLQKVDIIFGDEFKNIIDEVNDKVVRPDEVETMINMYRDLGLVMDGVFFIARTPNGKLNDEKIELARRMVKGLVMMWRNLRMSMKGLKIHAIENHLIGQMQGMNGIGDYLEDFVEQGHQKGVRDEGRTKGLSRGRAFASHARWEFNSNNVKVIEAKMNIRNKTSRSPRRRSREIRENEKAIRHENRMNSLRRIESGVYSMIEDYKLGNA